jgi:uncharacterized membrane protein YedE/YeeE
MIEFLRQPWHWLITGTIIGLIVPTLLLIGNKRLGVSSFMRHICAICFPRKITLFKYEWKKEMWNIFFVIGIFLGGLIANQFLSNPQPIQVAQTTKIALAEYGITDFSKILPIELFNFKNIFTIKGFFFFIIGGLFIGFGSRYASGCTSGHSIMGIANLQWPSVIATFFFMIGGILCAKVILPIFFKIV